MAENYGHTSWGGGNNTLPLLFIPSDTHLPNGVSDTLVNSKLDKCEYIYEESKQEIWWIKTVSISCHWRIQGAAPARAPPNGIQFFRFHIHFHQKVPVLEVGAPPTARRPPRPPNGKSLIRHCLLVVHVFNFVCQFVCLF